MAFKGWGEDAVDFFDGLEEDNSKAYWQAHKHIYEASVRRPMEELLAELSGEFGPGRIFRPYRDVRFSADKSPYKTSIAAQLEGGGYVQLSAAGLGVGSGMYHMPAEQLARYRAAVAAELPGQALANLVADARRSGMEVIAHETLKTVPRGFDRAHPRAELLRLKGLVTWREWPAGTWLASSRARTRVVEFLRGSRPICDWLDAHVGPQER
ncbi:MAG: DUF2461 domain-containing protein [Acidimicrobiaceae bacterium]|nr:DUF2461 domain-containing protein [Acidimicrobiaceae bacterium]